MVIQDLFNNDAILTSRSGGGAIGDKETLK